MKKYSPLFFFAATVESFQVVETLSDKAVLIHQTLKVEHFYYNTLTIASWVIIRISCLIFFHYSVAEDMACFPERCALCIGYP